METKKTGEIFSVRLKMLRQAHGLTIEEFANKVGISKSSVGYYENQNRVPDILVAGRMAEVLKVSTDYLIGRSTLFPDDLLRNTVSNELSKISSSLKRIVDLIDELGDLI